jgi:hypothetical protein
MSNRSNIWLSVDWDYFVREDPSWDFGHAELPDFQDLLWNMRVAQFNRRGEDLVEETSLMHADPHPAAFWGRLSRLGYNFDNVRAIVVGDSHRHAYKVFRRSLLEGPSLSDTRIVHFDAHHDLTYNMARFEGEAGREEVTCENWLLMTHLAQPKLKSLIVYPEWKGLREWHSTFGENFERYPMLKRAIERYTEPCCWPSSRVEESAGDVELVYICRSSAWTPPWHDESFIRFAKALQQMAKVPLDTPFLETENMDPLEPRSFDREQAIRTLGSEHAFISAFQGHA